MLKVKVTGLKELRKALQMDKSIKAQHSTIGTVALRTKQEALARIRSQMTLRNSFTEESIQVDIHKTRAVVGSTAPYMMVQEFGGIKRARGRGVVIPTAYASGETRRRTKLPRPGKRLKIFNLLRRSPFYFAVYNGKPGIYIRDPRLGVRMVYDLSRPSVQIPENPWLEPVVDEVALEIFGLFKKAYLRKLR